VVLPAELADRRIIYFAFDSDSISAEDQALIAAHARFMAGRAGVRIRLEGHTDQRGTREYNVGLGERRAQAVRRALGLQGVAEARLSTVSYGEEQPAVAGEDETAYSRNRRVELVYTAE
jgi:peptidoglycan-associated lipoprotein